MNPFDLPGPPFLVFYAALVAAVFWATWHGLELIGDRPGGSRLIEPYAIAYLRAGWAEAARVAALSLIDRGLIAVEGDRLRSQVRWQEVRDPIERVVVSVYAGGAAAEALVRSPSAQEEIERTLAPVLARSGHFPDAAAQRRRGWLVAGATASCVVVAVVKLGIAYERGRHNVFLLILFALVAAGVGLWMAGKAPARPTRRGQRALDELSALLEASRDRARELRASDDNPQVTLLAAVFGVGMFTLLPAFAYTATVFPKAEPAAGGTSCGSACGASCGGGGCGGGCGGCGG